MQRIAICAPATPLRREYADQVLALAAAEFPEIELAFHDQCFVEDGHFAGSDDIRAAALLECANDPDFDAVWFAKGGYGSNRIIDAILEGIEKPAHEKTYLGYSDCGFLLGTFHRLEIGAAVHGPMPVDIGRPGGEEAVRRSLKWFAGDRSVLEPDLDRRPTLAFNLTTLVMMLGHVHCPDFYEHVIIIEEVAEHLYAIDRMLFALTQDLHHCAGIRLGQVTDVPDNDRPFGADATDIVQDWCARRGIPYLGRAQIGHTSSNRIVPFGVVEPCDPA